MLIDLKKLKSRSLLVLSVAFALGAIGTVLYYIFFPSAAFFHSDCADTILWTQASVEGKTLFNPDFGYAALLPFGGTAVMIPLVAIFGVGMTAQRVGMAIFTLLFFAAVFYLCKTMKLGLNRSLFAVGTLALTLCASAKMREIFYEHVIYYSIGILIICVLLSLYLRVTEENSFKKRAILFAVMLVFTFAGSFDGTQVAASAIFPVLFAGACEIFFSKENLFSKKNLPSFLCLGSIAIVTVAGIVTVSSATQGMGIGYANAYSSYSDMSEWVNNLMKLPKQWCELFGVDAFFGMNMFSPESIINLVRIATALIVALVPVAALIFITKLERPVKMLVLTHFGMTAVIIFGYVFGILSLANWRLSPIICTGVLVCIAMMKQVSFSVPLKRTAALVGCLFVLFGSVSVKKIVDMPRNGIEQNKYYEVVQFLESKGLNYGFATFWKSQTITVLSDSKVKVMNTDMNDDGITPCAFQTNTNWFLEQEDVDRYFVLADINEYFTVIQTDDAKYFEDEPVEIIDELDGYLIFVYENTDFLY